MISNRPRILVVDEHTVMADLCRKLLETEFDVVVIVSNGHAKARSASELKPDVNVIDIAKPVLNGLDRARQIKATMPADKLLFLTTNSDMELDAEGIRRGASGYLLKTCVAAEMVSAVRDVLRGKSYMSQTLCKYEIDYLHRKGNKRAEEDERLTERQREVLQLLAEGKAMKEVGDILNMTTRTVAFHKYRIMESLGAKSNAELVRYAVRNHLVSA